VEGGRTTGSEKDGRHALLLKKRKQPYPREVTKGGEDRGRAEGRLRLGLPSWQVTGAGEKADRREGQLFKSEKQGEKLRGKLFSEAGRKGDTKWFQEGVTQTKRGESYNPPLS